MRNALLFFTVLSLNIGLAQVSDFKTIDFTRADNRAKLQEGHALGNLPILAYRLTHDLSTEVEKFRAIYTWVCTNIKGDSNQHDKVSRKRRKYKKR